MDATAWIRSQLPPLPARVLEVGCGDGELARALDAAGYEVLAIDPHAPEGEMFERTTIEKLEGRGTFDAVVASRSLHHVDDLDIALERIAELAPRFVVDEFAWDRLDEPTARWYDAQRALSPDPPPASSEWRSRHEHLWGYDALRAALGRHFVERTFELVPYFHRYMHVPELEAREAELIAAGQIQALAFRYVGEPGNERPGADR